MLDGFPARSRATTLHQPHGYVLLFRHRYQMLHELIARLEVSVKDDGDSVSNEGRRHRVAQHRPIMCLGVEILEDRLAG